jgi:hypothetical protein
MNYLAIVRAARKARKVRASEEASASAHVPQCEKSEICEKSPEVQMEGAVPGWVPHPLLSGLRVYRGSVEASTPPAGWNGVIPADCGRAPFCTKLGPCPARRQSGSCALADDDRWTA